MLHFFTEGAKVYVLCPQEICGFSCAFLSQGYTKMYWKECHPKWTINVEMIKDGNYHA